MCSTHMLYHLRIALNTLETFTANDTTTTYIDIIVYDCPSSDNRIGAYLNIVANYYAILNYSRRVDITILTYYGFIIAIIIEQLCLP